MTLRSILKPPKTDMQTKTQYKGFLGQDYTGAGNPVHQLGEESRIKLFVILIDTLIRLSTHVLDTL